MNRIQYLWPDLISCRSKSRRAWVFELAKVLLAATSMLTLPVYGYGNPTADGELRKRVGERFALPIAFVPNEGQFSREITYLAHGSQGVIGLSSKGEAWIGPSNRETPTIALLLRGARLPSRSTGLDPMVTQNHYFLGADPDQWQRNLPAFERVAFKQVYEGIDIEYHLIHGALRFDFVLAPGAAPDAIRFVFESPDAAENPLAVSIGENRVLNVAASVGGAGQFFGASGVSAECRGYKATHRLPVCRVGRWRSGIFSW